MSALENLHLADLHALAVEHGVGDFRRLRRRELIAALQEVDTDELELPSPSEERPGEAERPPEAEPVEEPESEAVEEPEAVEDGPTEAIEGVLELTRQRYGFVRTGGLAPATDDVYISAAQVRRCELRPGDVVSGPARSPRRGERHRALVHVDAVNGSDPAAEETRPEFEQLAPVVPDRRIELDAAADDVLLRSVDLLAPLAFGQRILVRATPRSGRTTLLRSLAAAAATAGAQVIVLLVDERPEEATAWRDAVPDAELAAATAEFAPIEHVRIAELALERGRRIAEAGGDAVLVCDSLSRLGFASGDAATVKRLFGSGRNLAGGGSLTVAATVVEGAQDEGEAERSVITTESALVTLDPELAADGVVPALAPRGCRISNEDQLRDAAELDAARRLRSMLADLDSREAAALLRERVAATRSNAELLQQL